MMHRRERHEVVVEGRIGRYAVAGSGEPLVLIHGLSGSTRWWEPVLPALAQEFRVYLLNLPGFGALRRRQALLPLNAMAPWVRSWMGVVGLSRAHLIGHSMGGFICLQLAASTPECVDRLVLVGPAGVPVVRGLTGYALPLVRTARRITPALIPILAYDAFRAGPPTLLRAANDLLHQDIRGSLPNVTAPTLLVWGDHDTLVPLAVGEAIERQMENARLVVLPGTGHVPMFDRPAEFSRVVLEFLREASAT